jgi:hypothetical protein
VGGNEYFTVAAASDVRAFYLPWNRPLLSDVAMRVQPATLKEAMMDHA